MNEALICGIIPFLRARDILAFVHVAPITRHVQTSAQFIKAIHKCIARDEPGSRWALAHSISRGILQPFIHDRFASARRKYIGYSVLQHLTNPFRAPISYGSYPTLNCAKTAAAVACLNFIHMSTSFEDEPRRTLYEMYGVGLCSIIDDPHRFEDQAHGLLANIKWAISLYKPTTQNGHGHSHEDEIGRVIWNSDVQYIILGIRDLSWPCE